MPYVPAAARALYRQRKRDRKCIKCGAGLQEADVLMCIEHHADFLDYRAKYARSPKGLKVNAKLKAKWRKARRDKGLCIDCPAGSTTKAEPGGSRCEPHRAAMRVIRARYLDRVEAARAAA
jgi:hypothetical protein